MRTLRNGALAIAFTLGSISFLQAQERMSLSLEDAIEKGLENSKQLKVALSKSKEAGFAAQESRRGMAPDLDISGQYMKINEPTISMGTTFTEGSSSSGESSDSESGLGVSPKHLALGMATVKMPLFTGFRASNGIRSASYLEKAALLDAENQKSEVILNLVDAYVNLYKAQETVKLVAEDLQEAEKRVQDFKRMEENGILALNDLLKAQLQESNTSLALLDARNMQQVSNYNMDLLLGLDETTQLTLDSINIDQLQDFLSASDLSDKALADRKDLQAMGERERATETAVKIAKGAYWPSVALSGGYAALDIDQVATVTNALNVGVGMSFNLAGLYKNGSHVSQVKEQYAQTQLMHQQLTDKVKSEVFQSFSNYMESQQRMDVYKKAEQQAKENYRIVKDKHQNSLATTTDLLDADVDLLQSELNLRFSKADVLLAYCKLLEVSGQLDDKSMQLLHAN